LYRTSGRSAIVQLLIRAAEHGKQVAALVELKARFDEAANIEWARALEEAGVHVTYGLVGLKTHCKTTMVVRDEGGVLRRYCHIGTGNYNDTTAKTYEDVGLFTSSESLGRDVTQLFNFLTGYSRKVEYDQLLVAPHTLRHGLYDLIDTEIAAARAGRPGAMLMKMNSLVDAPIIDRLYAASRAGVDIELIIRGICCLRPGVPGVSENIRVRSLIGRYLEHSRIFRFANGAGPSQPAVYISSADLMPRNLDRRVEIIAPVHDPVCVDRLGRILDTELADNQLAWTLDAYGVWQRVRDRVDDPAGETGSGASVNAHEVLQHVALGRTRRHELDEESTAAAGGTR
jgi:polyphosphate kinase